MGWLSGLFGGHGLRPQTVGPVETRDGRVPEVSELLRAWLEAAFSAGEQAEAREAEALRRLRADPARAVADIMAAYERCPATAYALRWALVYCAGRLQSHVSLPFLVRVLQDPIPPEGSQDIHLFSTVAEETSLRCRAIHGIARMVPQAVEQATANLLDQLSHSSQTVRVTACQVLRELPGRPVPDTDIRRRLPPEEADWVLGIRRVSIQGLMTPIEPRKPAARPRPPGGVSGADLSRFGEQRAPRIGR